MEKKDFWREMYEDEDVDVACSSVGRARVLQASWESSFENENNRERIQIFDQ